jgi:hypothetical protein
MQLSQRGFRPASNHADIPSCFLSCRLASQLSGFLANKQTFRLAFRHVGLSASFQAFLSSCLPHGLFSCMSACQPACRLSCKQACRMTCFPSCRLVSQLTGFLVIMLAAQLDFPHIG